MKGGQDRRDVWSWSEPEQLHFGPGEDRSPVFSASDLESYMQVIFSLIMFISDEMFMSL